MSSRVLYWLISLPKLPKKFFLVLLQKFTRIPSRVFIFLKLSLSKNFFKTIFKKTWRNSNDGFEEKTAKSYGRIKEENLALILKRSSAGIPKRIPGGIPEGTPAEVSKRTVGRMLIWYSWSSSQVEPLERNPEGTPGRIPN